MVSGKIAELIGPHLKVSRTAHANLTRCFPKMHARERAKIIQLMWNNLGRIVGELPHWANMREEQYHKRVKFIGLENIKKSKKTIFLSAHLANFELASSISRVLALDLNLIYRPANNPLVNHLINSQRTKCGVKLFAKGIAGLKHICDVLRNNGNVAMLVDQKTNDSELVDFFGFPARTTMLPAKLAAKFNAVIIMAKIKRMKGAYYTVEFFSPIVVNKTDDPKMLTQKINLEFEKWIREAPEQWFWVHKRWN